MPVTTGDTYGIELSGPLLVIAKPTDKATITPVSHIKKLTSFASPALPTLFFAISTSFFIKQLITSFLKYILGHFNNFYNLLTICKILTTSDNISEQRCFGITISYISFKTQIESDTISYF